MKTSQFGLKAEAALVEAISAEAKKERRSRSVMAHILLEEALRRRGIEIKQEEEAKA